MRDANDLWIPKRCWMSLLNWLVLSMVQFFGPKFNHHDINQINWRHGLGHNKLKIKNGKSIGQTTRHKAQVRLAGTAIACVADRQQDLKERPGFSRALQALRSKCLDQKRHQKWVVLLFYLLVEHIFQNMIRFPRQKWRCFFDSFNMLNPDAS